VQVVGDARSPLDGSQSREKRLFASDPPARRRVHRQDRSP